MPGSPGTGDGGMKMTKSNSQRPSTLVELVMVISKILQSLFDFLNVSSSMNSVSSYFLKCLFQEIKVYSDINKSPSSLGNFC